jgi:hypothetical protein
VRWMIAQDNGQNQISAMLASGIVCSRSGGDVLSSRKSSKQVLVKNASVCKEFTGANTTMAAGRTSQWNVTEAGIELPFWVDGLGSEVILIWQNARTLQVCIVNSSLDSCRCFSGARLRTGQHSVRQQALQRRDQPALRGNSQRSMS